MSTKKMIAGLAIAAGLVAPTTASAQVNVKAQYEQVDFHAAKHQCIAVSVRRLHRKTWEPLDADTSDDCATSFTFYPDTPDRTGVSYFKYRIKRVVITGGKATVAPPPPSDDGYSNTYSCFDEIDNDGDGRVDDADEDLPDAQDADGDPDILNTCDRGAQPLRIATTKTLRTGWIRVKTEYWPAERVYQYVNGRYNDRFFNYCVSKGKNLHSASHGRFYCIEPGFTYRETALRKP